MNHRCNPSDPQGSISSQSNETGKPLSKSALKRERQKRRKGVIPSTSATSSEDSGHGPADLCLGDTSFRDVTSGLPDRSDLLDPRDQEIADYLPDCQVANNNMEVEDQTGPITSPKRKLGESENSLPTETPKRAAWGSSLSKVPTLLLSGGKSPSTSQSLPQRLFRSYGVNPKWSARAFENDFCSLLFLH